MKKYYVGVSYRCLIEVEIDEDTRTEERSIVNDSKTLIGDYEITPGESKFSHSMYDTFAEAVEKFREWLDDDLRKAYARVNILKQEQKKLEDMKEEFKETNNDQFFTF